MLAALLVVLRSLALICSGHRAVAFENLALRQQLAVFKRTVSVRDEGIDAAKRYYAEFAEQQKELPTAQRLKVGLIYSFAANEEETDGLLGEEDFEAERLDQSSRDFLDGAIADYNGTFRTSFDTSTDKFQNYYKDLSQRLKKRELDLAIVVNMFLTGFDATTLNTL